MEAFPHFNVNAEATLQMDTSKKGPGENLIQKEKDILVTDTYTLNRVTPIDPEDDIQLPFRKTNMITTHNSTPILLSEHFSDSISNRPAQPEKNTLQKKYITRLKGYNNTDQLCDRESLLTHLPESWSHKESLHNRYRLINHGNQIIPVTYKEPHILSRPLKAMAQWKFQHVTQKEVYILSRPSKLQLILPDCGTPPLQSMANCSIASPLQLITQCTPREKDLPQLPSTLGAQEMYETHQEIIRRQQHKLEKNYIELTPGMAVWVQHRQNTSWEPATVVSQSSSNSYWIMQENGTDQPRVYRRTRTMLKIRCTDIRQTRHNYSQLTESESEKVSNSIYLQ